MPVRRIAIPCVMLLSAFLAAGCSKEEPTPAGKSAPATPPAAGGPGPSRAPAPTPRGGVLVSGKVSWRGEAPRPKKIEMEDADPKCHAQHQGKEVFDEPVAVRGDALQWVLVHVKQGLDGRSFESPGEPVVLDQRGCVYDPRVFGVMVNQPVEIRNSDPTMHNVHSYSKKTTAFNEPMATQGMKLRKSFKAREVVPIKCDVHKWMATWCHVLDHPYFAVSGPDGKWAFAEPLPPGEYELEAWHEKLPAQTLKLTVGDQPVAADFTFGG